MSVAWDDLRTVMMLVRHRSLAGAAEALGVNYTTVARRVRRAEDALNQLLFERLSDGYRPTEAAHILAVHADQMEITENSMMRQLQGAETELSGVLTITAPQLLIASFLAPVIDQFTKAHPRIELRILATNDLLDLTRREADLAIRISKNPGDTLTGLRLLRQENASFSSQDVADRIASKPKEMIDWIVYDAYPNVPKGIGPEFPNNNVRFRFDDMVAMVGAAQAGLGVVRMPVFLGRATAGLVQVPVLQPQPYADIWVVGHPDVWPSQKLRAFRDVLVGYCKTHRQQFVA
ncbi:LysR family transcriptional regulator [Sulfitobacter sp. SK012]|uniref:LysR family transcriptional regulator n=1 Tax=Sulfitobacter sp. SK012 TaxID=1389005 RepID=UPI000E0C9E82|nr:LysR family transcriptional regulator [Sulfitobacter sp. SK012]AXI48727.1 LysR family transcriptional regulator [Sulfitobacter sp. SK012]